MILKKPVVLKNRNLIYGLSACARILLLQSKESSLSNASKICKEQTLNLLHFAVTVSQIRLLYNAKNVTNFIAMLAALKFTSFLKLKTIPQKLLTLSSKMISLR